MTGTISEEGTVYLDEAPGQIKKERKIFD